MTAKNKYVVAARCFLLAVAFAVLNGYLIDIGIKLFPSSERYIDNVVALIIIIPMIYFVFIPFFKAFGDDEGRENRGGGS